MDRDLFLARVGRASMTSHLPDPLPIASNIPEPDTLDLAGLFRERAQAMSAVVHGPVTRHGAPRVVAGIAGGHGATTFICWDDLPVAGVASTLQSAGMRRLDHQVPDEGRTAHNVDYGSLDVGVTGADAALAESGSLVLAHGPGRPRMASLIPDVHIALLDIATLQWTLAHWAGKNPEIAANTTNLVLVTGPSRTADIEQQLNLGVHGPRHVHIVMIR